MIENANLVIAGVGGQGVVSLAQLLSQLAADNGLNVKQSEVHGMAQRGGSVSSHVRFSKKPIASAIIAPQEADFVLGSEPLETLRALEFLKPDGIVITSSNSLENPDQIPDYPLREEILGEIKKHKNIIIDSLQLAKRAGNPKTESVVLFGVLAPFLEISKEEIERYIHLAFDRKGDMVVKANLEALELGKREFAFSQIEQILENASRQNRYTLLETEVYQILELLDVSLPKFHFLSLSEIEQKKLSEKVKGILSEFASEKVVLKIVSPDLSHKQDIGGVIFLENDTPAVNSSLKNLIGQIRERLPQAKIKGALLSEFVPHSTEFGQELLLGIKQDPALGPVVTFGAGGSQTEFYAQKFGSQASSIRSSYNLDQGDISKMISETALADILCGRTRKKKVLISEESLVTTIEKFAGLAERFSETNSSSGFVITQAEVNPFAISDQRLVALDARLQFAVKKNRISSRPIHKIKNLLYPESVLVIGASAEKKNPGRVILQNLLETGKIPQSKIYLLHRSASQIDGCQAFDSLDKVPPVDLAIISVEAQAAGDLLRQLLEKNKAHSAILIPGGFGETEAGRKLEEELKELISSSHFDSDEGMLVNGGNCLGILSPSYNSFFIAKYKLPLVEAKFRNLASISQSGAYLVSQISNLQGLILPSYAISVGNQIDLTVSDYLEFLSQDERVDVFSIYLEGFKPSDGRKFLEVAQRVTQSGKKIIFYKAGRTQLGERAAFSHTAAIAGEYRVLESALPQVGVTVCQTLEEFEDLTKLAVFWSKKKISGNRLGILSNAGFECTVAADNLKGLKLAELSNSTWQKIKELLPPGIVDLHHPVDATPITDSEKFAEIVRALLEDQSVDVVLASPLAPTQALENLAPGPGYPEDIYRPQSLPMRLIELNQISPKPILVCLDSGPLYDPCVRLLETEGVPCLRKIDRALNALQLFLS